MPEKVAVEDVNRVAELAHIELTPDESRRLLHDLNEILGYVAQLNELDTADIVPLAQVSELEGAPASSVLRDDVTRPCLDRATVMQEAPETDRAFFKVPRVIER
jgi:aspartyl-tRNA(Asn)/glutamyl-tRNA(Gln) amidotransferase subunit C